MLFALSLPTMRILTAVAAILFSTGICDGQESAPNQASIRTAIEKALPQLRKGSEGHMANRTCFACHNQAHVLIAMRAAEKFGGFAVDKAFAEANAKHTLKFLARNEETYKKGTGQGGQADTAGYALWLLDLAKTPPNETTSAVVEYLIQYHADWGYWRVSGNRPPSEASHFSTTYAALRGLKSYGTEAQKTRVAERIAKAKDWLEKTPAADTEDAVFRLRGLTLVASEKDAIVKAAKELWDLQREEGGWSQTKEMASDAYATGSAMVALAEADAKATEQDSYRRSVQYLLRTQKEDGTWQVTTHSKPFQEYFETGFPHMKDQFISSAATGWAVAALAMVLTAPTK
jgi:Squalene-hopene cyclase C-terminal domain